MAIHHGSTPPARGFTLVEMLITVAVAGILVCTTLPSFSSMIDTRRIDGAATQLSADLQFARTQAILRSRAVRVSFQTPAAGGSCYVIHTGAAGQCDCSASGAAVCEAGASEIRTVQLEPADRVTVQANAASLRFDPTLGTSTPAGTLQVVGHDGRAVHHVVNIMGRVRSCSPKAAVSGYPAC